MSFKWNKNAILRLHLILILLSSSIYFVSSEKPSDSSFSIVVNQSAFIPSGNGSALVPLNNSAPGASGPLVNLSPEKVIDAGGSGNASAVAGSVSTTTTAGFGSTSTLQVPDAVPVLHESPKISSGDFFYAGDPIEINVYTNASCDLWIREPSDWFLAMQNNSGDTVYVYSTTVPGNYSIKADCFSVNYSAQAVKGFVILAGFRQFPEE